MRIKLSEWAKENNLHYQTALRYYHKGIIQGTQLPTGTILIDVEDDLKEDNNTPIRAITYARVSSHENKNNAKTQSQRLRDWCIANGYTITKEITETASGLNDKRPKLTKILTQTDDYDVLVVEHKDRLTRFGYEYIKIALEKDNKKIIVINDTTTDEEDLMQDFISLVTSFSARIYGRRRSKRATEKIIEELKEQNHAH